MSLLRTFERASSCRNTYQVASQSLFAFLCPAIHEQHPPKAFRRHERRSRDGPARALPAAADLDTCFITALVQAGSCHGRHAKQYRSHGSFPSKSELFRSRRVVPNVGSVHHQQRRIHTKPSRPAREHPSPASISKEDLHSLVDIYDARKEAPPWQAESLADDVDIGPGSLERPWVEATYFTDNHYLVYPEPWSEASQVLESISARLDDPDTPHEELYALYQKLPGNRVNYIPSAMLVRLINHLSLIPASHFQKEYAGHYLSLLYDMRAEKLDVGLALWTTAIRFLGLSEGPRQAVRLWREMEQHYGLRANNYVFSVLFDLAIKSQHFALAEMLENESRERRIKLDRISRMSRIFYYGILGDGLNVRRSYAQLVDSGEIVDTAVLTNVITALIDAGELPAAEETFERMKRLHAEKKGATQAPHTWRQRRELRKLLTEAGHCYRDDPKGRSQFQDAAPVNPDWRTYRAFIRHHAQETGEWHAIDALLTEMQKAEISLNTEIYVSLFQGFAKHGGIQLASWNKRNLERLWQQFEKACVDDPRNNILKPKVAVAVVTAFYHCADRRRAKAVWEAMLQRWTPPRRVEEYVDRLLNR